MRFGWIACLLFLAAAGGARAQAPTIVPKLVVQRGHLMAPAVYAPTADGRFLLAASSYDSSMILWSTHDGQELDALPIPRVDRLNARFRRLAVVGSIASLWSLTPRESDHRWVCRRYDFNLETRGTPAITDLIDADTPCAEAALPPLLPDGRIIRRDGNGFTLGPLRPGGRPIAIMAAHHDGIENVDVTPDGRRMAMMRIDGTPGSKTRPPTSNVQVWDVEAGKIINDAHDVPGRYARVRWLDNERYALIGEYDPAARGEQDAQTNDPPPTLIVDGASNAVLDTMRTLAGMLPYRSDGTMLGLGRDECGYGATATDLASGLWLRVPHGRWRPVALPELTGNVVDSVGMSADGRTTAVVFRRAARCNGAVYGQEQILLIDGELSYGGPVRTRLVSTGTSPNERIYRVDFANDNSKVIVLGDSGAHVIELASGKQMTIKVDPTGISDITSDGTRLVMLDQNVRDTPVYDLGAGGKPIATLPGDFAFSGAMLPGRSWMWVAGLDGSMRYYRVSDWRLLVGQFPLQRRGFVAVDALGRYDTNASPDAAAFRWLMPDRPWQSLAGQTFMREYYEPGLVARTLDCTNAGTCATALRAPPSLAALNRVLPEVTAMRAKQIEGGMLQVDVTIGEGIDADATNGKTRSGAFDLRLFRDGHLVGQSPEPQDGATTRGASWRDDARLIAPGDGQPAQRQFLIALPTGRASVRLSAYAFNEDRVKGETREIEVPITARTAAPRRAYVIAIGINDYRESGWRLRFAAGDATALAASVDKIGGYQVIPIRMIADGKPHKADKAQLHALIDLLAGKEAGRAMLTQAGIDVSELRRITPDDALLISFAGHGDTDSDRNFYLVPQDAQRSADGKPAWRTLVSSAELTDWLRPVDAGEMAIIIDACHSAASVYSPTFKPAPMGDPGLGQLAFDKGIRILAATQGDDVAMESATLHHGLLTYAVAEEGLSAGKADLDKNGVITLDEVLRYAQIRLPAISLAGTAGQAFDLRARTLILDPSSSPAAPPHKQQPALFDFTGAPSSVVVRRLDLPPPAPAARP